MPPTAGACDHAARRLCGRDRDAGRRAASRRPTCCCAGSPTRRSTASTRWSAWAWRLRSPPRFRPAPRNASISRSTSCRTTSASARSHGSRSPAPLLLLVLYALLAWRVGVYAEKLQARSAETIFVRLPMAPFVWTIAAFLAISVHRSDSSRCLSVCVSRCRRRLAIRRAGALAAGQAAQHVATPIDVSDRAVIATGLAILAGVACLIFAF